jgi:hypothetical protein
MSKNSFTPFVNLSNLQQGHSEPVELFHCRIFKVVEELQSFSFPLPENQFSFNDGSAFASGASSAFSRMALHLFISNLRSLLRQQVLKLPPTTLNEAFQKAREIETILDQDDKQKKNDSIEIINTVKHI